jgi:hypothetical protein
MELKTTKKYVVDGVSYDTKIEANKAMNMQLLNEAVSQGSDYVIKNANEVIKALNIVTKN